MPVAAIAKKNIPAVAIVAPPICRCNPGGMPIPEGNALRVVPTRHSTWCPYATRVPSTHKIAPGMTSSERAYALPLSETAAMTIASAAGPTKWRNGSSLRMTPIYRGPWLTSVIR